MNHRSGADLIDCYFLEMAATHLGQFSWFVKPCFVCGAFQTLIGFTFHPSLSQGETRRLTAFCFLNLFW